MGGRLQDLIVKTVGPQLVEHTPEGFKQALRKSTQFIGKNLPREAYYKLTPVAKLEKWTGIPFSQFFAPLNRNKTLQWLDSCAERVDEATSRIDVIPSEMRMVRFTPNSLVEKLGESVVTMSAKASPLGKLLAEPAVDSLGSAFASTLLSKTTSRLTPLNEWRKGLGLAVRRGRQSDTERTVGFVLRMVKFENPQQAAKTLFTFLVSWSLYQVYFFFATPEVPLGLPEPGKAKTEQYQPSPPGPGTLQKLPVRLPPRLDGGTYYLVRCLACQNVYIIETWAQLQRVVVFDDLTDTYLSYCTKCKAFRPVEVRLLGQ